MDRLTTQNLPYNNYKVLHPIPGNPVLLFVFQSLKFLIREMRNSFMHLDLLGHTDHLSHLFFNNPISENITLASL